MIFWCILMLLDDFLMHFDASWWFFDAFWCSLIIFWCILMLLDDFLMRFDASWWFFDAFWCFLMIFWCILMLLDDFLMHFGCFLRIFWCILMLLDDFLMHFDAPWWFLDAFWCFLMIFWCILMLLDDFLMRFWCFLIIFWCILMLPDDFLMHFDASWWFFDAFWCFLMIFWCVLMLLDDFLMHFDACWWFFDAFWCLLMILDYLVVSLVYHERGMLSLYLLPESRNHVVSTCAFLGRTTMQWRLAHANENLEREVMVFCSIDFASQPVTKICKTLGLANSQTNLKSFGRHFWQAITFELSKHLQTVWGLKILMSHFDWADFVLSSSLQLGQASLGRSSPWEGTVSLLLMPYTVPNPLGILGPSSGPQSGLYSGS